MNQKNHSKINQIKPKVMKISDFLRALENAGEVGISVALHTMDGATLTQSKPCCFVLDPPKERTVSKKAGLAPQTNHGMLEE